MHLQQVKAGEIFDKSEVIRVDRRFGLMLKVPTTPVPTPAYVNVSNLLLQIFGQYYFDFFLEF